MPPKKVSEFIISENDKSLHSNIASNLHLGLSFRHAKVNFANNSLEN